MSKILQRISGIGIFLAIVASPVAVSVLDEQALKVLIAYLAVFGLAALVVASYVFGAWLILRSFE